MKKRMPKRPTQEEIDRIVVDQASDPSAWEKPIHVTKPKTTSFTIPLDLAARAAFLARLHGSSAPDEWVAHIIRERIELEEVALSEAKRDLSTQKTRRKPVRRIAKNPG